MLIGHFAVGFAAKRAAPESSLGVLIAGALLLDLLWPVFLLSGLEHARVEPGNTAVAPLAFTDYPISHSLLAAALWASAAATAFWAVTRYRAGAGAVGIAVLSHWFLDALAHRPDLPYFPGSTRFAGLGLWNSVAGTVLVEGALFVAGVWIYAAATRSRNRAGGIAFWSFVAALTLLYVANLAGPPPPGIRAVAVAGLASIVFPFWAAWFDRRRFPRKS